MDIAGAGVPKGFNNSSPAPSYPTVPGQFDDCESDKATKRVRQEKSSQTIAPLKEHPYYLILPKLYGKYVQTTSLVPYQHLGSLHVTNENHLFFTSNRLDYSNPTKGFFWCCRNPLKGIDGCRVELAGTNKKNVDQSNLINWQLDSPALNTRGTNLSVGMYSSPITTAKPMTSRLIFFGDNVGKVGVAWYYFLDELDTYSYKLESCRIEMSNDLEIGLFNILWTDTKWLTHHNSKIIAIDVCPRDFRTVVSCASNGSVFTWDADVFLVKNRFPKEASGTGEITYASYSPSSLNCFATSSKKGCVLLWDMRVVRPFKVANIVKNKYLTSMVWKPENDNLIIGGTSNGEILMFDIRRPNPYDLQIKYQFNTEVSHLVKHPSKSYLATSSLKRIDHLTGSTPSTYKTIHRGEMRNMVSGIAFYEDYIFTVDNGCCMTAVKYTEDEKMKNNSSSQFKVNCSF